MSLSEAARRRGVGGPWSAALDLVDRAPFLLPEARDRAGDDVPLPIGEGHHQAEPSCLARMAELAGAAPGRRLVVLGAGSGYLCALIRAAGAEVVGVERSVALAARARELGLDVREGDAHQPIPGAPVDGIVVAACVARVGAWLDALGEGGALVAPIGDERHQELVCWRIVEGRVVRSGHGAVRFALLG